MKRKIKAILVTGILLLAMTGCGGGQSKSIEVFDATGKTKVDVTMGDTGATMDFPLAAAAGGTVKTYAVLSIPKEVSAYDYKDGATKISMTAKDGYEIAINAYDYSGASKTPGSFLESEKKSINSDAQNKQGEVETIKETANTCVLMVTYDRSTEVYAYFSNGSAMVKYKISYESDKSQNTVTQAKIFVNKLTGASL